MKRILAFILCALILICATSVFASAETEADTTTTEEVSMTDAIVNYFTEHLEEFSVIGTLILGIIYEIRKHSKLNGSIGTLNNNAIAIAENSSTTIKAALQEVADIAEVVRKYKNDFESLLQEVRTNAEEKQSLEETLAQVESFLKTAKLATLELSNEVAELLVLANIPNSKKDELYARHTKAVKELEAAEEVMSNDNTES